MASLLRLGFVSKNCTVHSFTGDASIRYLPDDAIDHAVPPTGVGIRSEQGHRHVQKDVSMQISLTALTRREKVNGVKVKPAIRIRQGRGALFYHALFGCEDQSDY